MTGPRISRRRQTGPRHACCLGEADLRELALREFLAGELRDSKTTVERILLAGLLQDVPGTLRMIG